jgi:TM2 domain-containing membrane protein YozV
MKTFWVLALFVASMAYAQSGSDLLYNGGVLKTVRPGGSLSTASMPLDVVQPTLEFQGTMTSDVEKKNVFLAAIYSAALPGMGELYAGNYSTGKFFTITEGIGWITWIAFHSYARWEQTDARSFASEHSGANINGKSDQFFIDIGDFASMNDYNTYQLQQRNIYGLYYAGLGQYWKWDNAANQQLYVNLRDNSDVWFNNASFVVAAIVANHLISAIDAARDVISNNHSAEADAFQLHAGVLGTPGKASGVVLSLSKSF